MLRIGLAVALALSVLVAPLAAGAQQPEKVWRIGVLRIGSPGDTSRETFRLALRDLGYVEGRNLVIEDRTADGRLNRLTGLAAELVHLHVDVIVASGVAGARAAQGTNQTIPILMFAKNPVGARTVRRPGQPGGDNNRGATPGTRLR